jgi:hypothetical protein
MGCFSARTATGVTAACRAFRGRSLVGPASGAENLLREECGRAAEGVARPPRPDPGRSQVTAGGTGLQVSIWQCVVEPGRAGCGVSIWIADPDRLLVPR